MLAGVVALAVLAASAAAVSVVIRVVGAELRKLPIQAPGGLRFHTLPENFGNWRMVSDDIMSAEQAAELGSDNYISRVYKEVDAAGEFTGRIVRLHCVYYTGMIDTVPHVPERCMVGGGMEYAGASQVVPVPLDMSRLTRDPDAAPGDADAPLMSRNTRVNTRVRLPRGVENLQMMVTPFRDSANKSMHWAGYFFIANGGVVASANDVRLLAFNLSDDYAYYAKVQFDSPSVKSADELAQLAASMLDELFPDLMQRVPDWVAVQEGLYPPDNPRARLRGADAPAR